MFVEGIIDCDAALARGCDSVAALRRRMAQLGVSAAICRHGECLHMSPYFHNDLLLEACADGQAVRPCLFVTPDGREPDFSAEAYIRQILAQGCVAAWTSPRLAPYGVENPLSPWHSGTMLECLAASRLPLFLDYADASADTLHAMLERFPDLRLVLFNIPRLGRQSTLERLLELHPGLYLCWSYSFSIHGGYQALCRRFGSHRWVWGSGWPQAEPGASLTGLLYSGLAPEDLAAVAHGNAERLMAEIDRQA
jgi:hypothetical protein